MNSTRGRKIDMTRGSLDFLRHVEEMCHYTWKSHRNLNSSALPPTTDHRCGDGNGLHSTSSLLIDLRGLCLAFSVSSDEEVPCTGKCYQYQG